jgi:uncharacterized membrane protein YphA (DoxX/SURF4 family)
MAMAKIIDHEQSLTKVSHYIAYLRIGFGMVWLLDAVLKFNPTFYNGMLEIIKANDGGNPAWLDAWYNFWFTFLGSAPHFFTIVVIVLECFIAFSLLFGFTRKVTYLVGIVFSFLLWSVAEGFGGVFIGGETDPNAGIIYCLLFGLLFIVDTGAVRAKLALDNLLEKHLSWWQVFSQRKNGQ